MTGTPISKHYNFDRNLAFAEDLTLTADDVVQFASADVIFQIGPGRFDGTLIIDVSALSIADDDELYNFCLEGSNSSSFASVIETLAVVQLGDGAASARLGLADVSSVIGRYELPFNNVRPGVVYDYVRLNMDGTGSSFTITFTAWICPNSQ